MISIFFISARPYSSVLIHCHLEGEHDNESELFVAMNEERERGGIMVFRSWLLHLHCHLSFFFFIVTLRASTWGGSKTY